MNRAALAGERRRRTGRTRPPRLRPRIDRPAVPRRTTRLPDRGRVTRVFSEKISTRATKRPEPEPAVKLASEIRSSGVAVTLVVHEHERLGRGIELAMLAEELKTSGGAGVTDDDMLSMALHLRDQEMSLRASPSASSSPPARRGASTPRPPPSCGCCENTTNRPPQRRARDLRLVCCWCLSWDSRPTTRRHRRGSTVFWSTTAAPGPASAVRRRRGSGARRHRSVRGNLSRAGDRCQQRGPKVSSADRSQASSGRFGPPDPCSQPVWRTRKRSGCAGSRSTTWIGGQAHCQTLMPGVREN